MMAPMPASKSPSKAPTFLFSTADSDDSSPTPSSPPSTDAPKSQCSSLSEGESFEGFGENDRGGGSGSGDISSGRRIISGRILVGDDHIDSSGNNRTINNINNSSINDNNHNNNNNNNNNNSNVNSGGVELELAPHSTPNGNGDDDRSTISRHSWSRTSLRRAATSNPDNLPNRRWGSMRHSGRRQLGSNALANHLYRSSSFNSSGRSSNCDTTEEMYSDVSLEDVQHISHKLELLQRQVTDLTDSQNTVDDRTTRTKTEYAVLQARYHMLEEQYRESELRAEERLAEEQKRHRELLGRVERENELQNENCQIKIRTIEIEANQLRDETQRLRILCDKQSNDLHKTEEKLEMARDSIMNLTQDLEDAQLREKKLINDKQIQEELMIELSKELERLRIEIGRPAMPTTSPETLRLEELHMEMDELRRNNKILEEQNEELQAVVLTRGVEEGRHLLNGTLNSLAQELEEMSQTQDSVDSATLASLSQLQQAFQDKEDENLRLKTYIDTILLNIVENYPQLLEVKPSAMPNENSKIPKFKQKLSE